MLSEGMDYAQTIKITTSDDADLNIGKIAGVLGIPLAEALCHRAMLIFPSGK